MNDKVRYKYFSSIEEFKDICPYLVFFMTCLDHMTTCLDNRLSTEHVFCSSKTADNVSAVSSGRHLTVSMLTVLDAGA